MKKVIFIIRDGWGYRKSSRSNAIARARTPIDERLRKSYPWTLLEASGEAVGLPKGYQGNSEVGHLTIGAGRTVKQSLIRINDSIKSGDFFRKKEFLKAISNCKKNDSRLHIMGLLQKEGVHAHMDHLFALLDLCKMERFRNVYLHVITDGRDAPVKNGRKYLRKLLAKTKDIGFGEIVTISGRYYAMDRDRRWERTRRAYEAVAEGRAGEVFNDPVERMSRSYKRGITDEFIEPSMKKGYGGIKKNDSVIFYNSRTDRPRQLTQAMVEKNFIGWKRNPLNVFFVAMTDYYKPMDAKVAFKEKEIKDLLPEILSRNGIRQLRISETEKYAHVTFFLNGQKEDPEKGEDRILIPSPKVPTYDREPEMSIEKITERLLKEIKKEEYQFIAVNLVNCDMVGHTGNAEAIIRATEAVDRSVGRIVDAALLKDYSVFVFADHGNAEDQTRKWKTSHTVNPVPFILVSDPRISLKKGGGLKDVAPTALKIMGLKKPKAMDGLPLF